MPKRKRGIKLSDQKHLNKFSEKIVTIAKQTKLPSKCFLAIKLFKLRTIKSAINKWWNKYDTFIRKMIFLDYVKKYVNNKEFWNDVNKELILKTISHIKISKKQMATDYYTVPRKSEDQSVNSILYEFFKIYHVCAFIGYIESKFKKIAKTKKLRYSDTIWDHLIYEFPDSIMAKKLSKDSVTKLLNWNKKFAAGVYKIKEHATEKGKLKEQYGTSKLRDKPSLKEKVKKSSFEWWKTTPKKFRYKIIDPKGWNINDEPAKYWYKTKINRYKYKELLNASTIGKKSADIEYDDFFKKFKSQFIKNYKPKFSSYLEFYDYIQSFKGSDASQQQEALRFIKNYIKKVPENIKFQINKASTISEKLSIINQNPVI